MSMKLLILFSSIGTDHSIVLPQLIDHFVLGMIIPAYTVSFRITPIRCIRNSQPIRRRVKIYSGIIPAGRYSSQFLCNSLVVEFE